VTLAGRVRRRFPIGALTVGVVAVSTTFALVASCGSEAPVAAPTTAAAAPLAPSAEVAGATEVRPLVPAELESRLRSAVLEVRSTGCGFDRQGTVSLVDLGGGPTAMTNRHVVAGSSDAQVVLPDGSLVGAPVEGAVRDRDAATLGIAGLADTAAALPAAPTPLVGDEVVVAGFPDGAFVSSPGRVVSIEERVDDGGDVTVLLVDVPAASGVSGGVVVDSAGRAVGLVAARDPDSGNAVAYPFTVLAAPLESELPGC